MSGLTGERMEILSNDCSASVGSSFPQAINHAGVML
jgi:hypothetical protein